MSFQDLAITIGAKNQASAEFSRVVADAGRMASEIEANPISVEFTPIDVPEIPPIKVPVEVPEIPPIPAPVIEPIDVSTFSDVGAAIDEVNMKVADLGVQVESSGTVMTTSFQACAIEANSLGAEVLGATESISTGFQVAGEEIEVTTDRIKISSDSVKEMSRDLTTFGVGISAVGRLGETFGLLNSEQAACISTMGSALTAVSGVVRVIQILTSTTSIATVVQNALNISYATFLTLTGVGIAVVVAAAATMAYFASQMNSATASVRNYNAAASETTSYTRGIQRAGEDDLRRRGIE